MMVSKNKLEKGEIGRPQTPNLSRKNAEVLYVKSLEQATKLDYLWRELVPRSTVSAENHGLHTMVTDWDQLGYLDQGMA